MRIAAGVLILLWACGGDPDLDRSVEQPGDYEVGTARMQVTDAARGRALTLQLWYPTATAAVDVPIQQLEAEPIQTQYAGLLASAPAQCPGRTAHVALDAAPAPDAGFGVIAYSHCHDGTRLSNETTAERLASHGFVVVAVDHAQNTLWEHLADPTMDAPFSTAFLDTRAADIRFALDTVLGDARFAAHGPVGVFGHSYGGVTAGRVAETDPRIAAAAALAAPMENPLIPGVTLANIHVPLLFDVMVEDNSITQIGNDLIDDNYAESTNPTWELKVADAGHWSVSDLAGLVEPLFAPGCGDGMRQTGDGGPFTYLDNTLARQITASYVTAFFEAELMGDTAQEAYLNAGLPAGTVTSTHR